MPANDIYQLNVIGSVGKQYVENVLHYNVTAPPMPDDELVTAAAIITAWVGSVQSSYLACLPTDYLLAGYKCKRIKPVGGNTIVQVDGVSVGTQTGASVTSGQAPLFAFPVANAGLPHRQYNTAKLFLPAMTAGTVLGDIIIPAFLTAMGSFITQVIASLALGGTGSVQYGSYSKGLGTLKTITVGSPSLTLGTQRRRLRPALG
jgi:hypothetical protein